MLILYNFLLLLILKNSQSTTNIVSYLERNYSEKVLSPSVFWELELIYTDLFNYEDINEDLICNLSDKKKIALCDLIFSLEFYKDQNIYLNKVPLYLMKLPCNYQKLSMDFYDDFNEVKSHKMYLCPARHEHVETSFIEDDFYNHFYLSVGPYHDSITVYISRSDSYFIFDYIFNINISKLEELEITTKNVVYELKLNKNIFRVNNENDRLVHMYLNEKPYFKNDPVCELPYEKKISLCNIIFNQDIYKNLMKVTLNKAATYALNMSCDIRFISETLTESTKHEQTIYPCFGREITEEILNENTLINNYTLKFFLSSGPRRNSVFVYIYITVETEKIYLLFDLFGNIDLQNLKPTIITEDDLKVESEEAYMGVQKLITTTEVNYKQDLIEILLITNFKLTPLSENEIIQEKIKQARIPFIEKLEEAKRREQLKLKKKAQPSSSSSSSEAESDLDINEHKIEKVQKKIEKNDSEANDENLLMLISVINKNKSSTGENTSLLNVSEFIELGPQVYHRLLDKLRNEIAKGIIDTIDHKSSDTLTKKDKKAREKILKLKRDKLQKYEQKIEKEVKQLINKMEFFVLNRINEKNISLKEPKNDDDVRIKGKIKSSKK